ncbi:hypothetical protein Tco_0242337 [Tanacetum coccineum]
MHHRNAATKLLGHLLEPKLKYNSRIYKGKEIKHDIYTDLNIDITYKQAWRSKNVALESLSGCHVASFAQLPYYCHNLKMINDGTVTHIETDNEDRFKMVFIAFGVVGETGPSWTWFLSKLKECIGEAFAYELQIEGYKASMFILEDVQSYHLNDFIWAINETLEQLYIVYHVDDRQRMHTVELYSGTCTCRKWQLSGLSYGHVLAVCRVMGLTYFNHLAKGWFRRKALEGTYQELVYPVGEVSSWQRPNYLQVVKSPLMDKKLAGRPKSKACIRSQGEEPVPVRCGSAVHMDTTKIHVGKPFHKRKILTATTLLLTARTLLLTTSNAVLFRSC